MENKSTWLRTSLFANKDQWAYLLSNGIKPFIKQPSNAAIIEELVIELNHMSGENIRLAINMSIENAETVAHEMDNFFKSFFSKANFPEREVFLPVKGLFLPFPANTIQYGLYHDLPGKNEAITKIISKTSECIVEALLDDVVNEEALIMLAFYFHCALLTQAKEITGQDFSKTYTSEAPPDDDKIVDEEFLSQKYQENKIGLAEVEDTIRNYLFTEQYDNPSWLIEWMMVCKEVIGSQLAKNENIIANIHFCINRQLGLTNNMIRLVHYFLNNTYADSNIK